MRQLQRSFFENIQTAIREDKASHFILVKLLPSNIGFIYTQKKEVEETSFLQEYRKFLTFLSQQPSISVPLSKPVYISKQISFTQFNRNFPLKELRGLREVILPGTSSTMKQDLCPRAQAIPQGRRLFDENMWRHLIDATDLSD